jgi:hypothetical protein
VTKAQTIVEMLRYYTLAQETLNGPSGIHGTGELTVAMSSMWNDSYRELERCLKLLREERKSQYWHVTQRFIYAEAVTLEVPVKRDRNGNVVFKLPPNTELVAGAGSVGDKKAKARCRRWLPGVRKEKVKLGVAWLAKSFNGEPYLPKELEAA